MELRIERKFEIEPVTWKEHKEAYALVLYAQLGERWKRKGLREVFWAEYCDADQAHILFVNGPEGEKVLGAKQGVFGVVSGDDHERILQRLYDAARQVYEQTYTPEKLLERAWQQWYASV